jgi:peptide/nickel transport system permease protein
MTLISPLAKDSTSLRGRTNTARRFVKNRLSIVGILLIGSVVFFSIVLPFVMPFDPTKVDIANRLTPPNWEHLMGTDSLGRDLLVRVAFGGRISLAIGITGVAVAMVVGTAMGMVSAYYGGRVDLLMMRLIDMIMAFPTMLLAIIVAAILGVGLPTLILSICLFQVPNFARLVRGMVLSLREREFVIAARTIGAGDFRILYRHILPNCIGLIVVQTSLNCAWGVLSVASLSFLGLGVQAPTPELGSMVNDGRAFLREAAYYSAFPGLVITLSILGLNFIGDGLRDAFDIRKA